MTDQVEQVDQGIGAEVYDEALLQGMDAPAEGQDGADQAQQAAAQAQQAAPPKEEPRYVPLDAMLEERRRFQERLAAQEERERQLSERLARLEGPLKPAEAQAPDFLEDPKGYIDTAVQRIEQAAQEAREKAINVERATISQEQARAQMQEFVGRLQADEAAFVQRHNDYQQALEHVRASRFAELQAMAPQGATEAQIRQFQAQEELHMAAQAMASGRSPAELAYQLAQQRGYRQQQAQQVAEQGFVPQQPAGQPPRQRYQAPPGMASMTLGPGATPGNVVQQESVDGLDQFDAALQEAFGSR